MLSLPPYSQVDFPKDCTTCLSTDCVIFKTTASPAMSVSSFTFCSFKMYSAVSVPFPK